MTVPIDQEVDLLIKKLEGVAKTDTAVNKSPSNESIPSPMLNRGDTAWTQAISIPTIAAPTANLIVAYQNGNAIQCTADVTTVPIGGIYPTWLTGKTWWVPPEFGSTYSVQAYVGPPNAANIVATGTFITAAGQGGTGEWFFDYQAGLLNFIGETIPASLTSGNVVYITGYTYTGLIGVTKLPSNTNIGNININSTTFTSTNANLIAFGGTGGIVIPAGSSSQYPTNHPVGTTRFNTTSNTLETWDGSVWVSGGGGGGGSGSISDQQITPDGTSSTYTLNQNASDTGVLVSINGVLQLPGIGYNITGNNQINFPEVPLTSDIIDVRFISYASTVSALVNSSGNTSVNVDIGGNINFTTSSNVVAVINPAGVLNISTGKGIQLPNYTVAQASNIASPSTGQMIYVSNGNSGNPSLAVYDGTSWKRVALGNTISSS